MAVRLSGLSSGLDTESIIKELMSVQSMKKTKMENKLTKLEWKEDKWKELNQKIYDLYKDELSKLKTQSSYLTKSVAASDTTKATFTASSQVPTGTHMLSISEVASAQYITGNKIAASTAEENGTSVSINLATKITDLYYNNTVTGTDDKPTNGYIAIGTVLNLQVGEGETQNYTITEDTTVSDLTTWFKSNDISFTYDTTNQRFFISSMQSGKENAFTLTSSMDDAITYNTGGDDASSNLGEAYLLALNSAVDQYNSSVNKEGEDTAKATIEKYAQGSYTAKKEVYVKYITEKWNSIIGDKSDEITLEWDDEGNWSLTKDKDSDLSLATYRQQLRKADSNYDFDALMKATPEAGEVDYKEVYTAAYKSVVEGTYGSVTGTDQTLSGVIDPSKYSMESTFEAIESGNSALNLLGIGEIASDQAEGRNVTSGATYVKASDMTCTFNGAEYTSSSNTLTINGLTINAIEKTDSPIRINITNDTKAVYDSIKNFVKGYNEVLQSINDLYYADSARKYDVLTEEERDAMTEDQIEKWENRIKDASLRRDSTLNSIISAMRTVTSSTVIVDGKEYSLASYGINTGNYTEKGLLHIYGDSEDSTVADETDKLMAALSSDPDTVMQVFTKIGSELYSTLSDKMSSTRLSSALTFYNDKEITSLKKEYQEEIDDWEAKLSDMEDRYYSKFSAMETALSKLNSQTSYISSLFGSN